MLGSLVLSEQSGAGLLEAVVFFKSGGVGSVCCL